MFITKFNTETLGVHFNSYSFSVQSGGVPLPALRTYLSAAKVNDGYVTSQSC